eukprot:TRINITY_DN2156_c0_g2_i1.p1 TRINITY_DN2156_c0_g2~~TRINITY_DN2156_c0_g2_i1.p1  ORF type:complete len:393 (+),score=49.16 TRINITY_DN2156_c0_g2_i1:93-1181(+)
MWRVFTRFTRGALSTKLFWRTIIVFLLLYVLLLNEKVETFVSRDLAYIFRPIWDKKPEILSFNNTITNYGYRSVDDCKLYGFEPRNYKPNVYDIFLFGNEIDLLYLRIQELKDVVTKFVVVESDITFTGKSKELYFYNHRHVFDEFVDKIEYHNASYISEYGQYRLESSPMGVEGLHRVAMNTALYKAGVKTGDLVLVSDVDELYRAETIRMLTDCQGPAKIHIQMRNFQYSFEFERGKMNRPAVITYDPSRNGNYLSHGKLTETILADGGWHCSFCFPTIEDILWKMNSWGHNDRVKPQYQTREHIQKTICEGTDLFEMWPEEFTFRELICNSTPFPRVLTVHDLPQYFVEHQDRFPHLTR